MNDLQDSHLILATIFCLFFGIIFSIFTGRARKSGRLELLVPFFVAFGVFVVLIVLGVLLGLGVFLVGLLMFAAAGVPMAWEHLDWYLKAKERLLNKKS